MQESPDQSNERIWGKSIDCIWLLPEQVWMRLQTLWMAGSFRLWQFDASILAHECYLIGFSRSRAMENDF
jgi:hypothetical protein